MKNIFMISWQTNRPRLRDLDTRLGGHKLSTTIFSVSFPPECHCHTTAKLFIFERGFWMTLTHSIQFENKGHAFIFFSFSSANNFFQFCMRLHSGNTRMLSQKRRDLRWRHRAHRPIHWWNRIACYQKKKSQYLSPVMRGNAKCTFALMYVYLIQIWQISIFRPFLHFAPFLAIVWHKYLWAAHKILTVQLNVWYVSIKEILYR